MVRMRQTGITHVRAPERGVSGMERENGVQDGEVWKEGMGCKTRRFVQAPKHYTRMVAECVVGMECARLEDLDCAIGWGGVQMVRMWQPGTRHPNEGCQVWKEGMGCKTRRYVYAHKHDGKMVAERVNDMECA